MTRTESNVCFYKELAENIKPHGFRCYLYNEDNSAFLYVITPNNSWLCISREYFGGYNISYKYEPSKDFGTGCQCNTDPLWESDISVGTLLKAERYGKSYGFKGHIEVPNKYDERMHRETVWRSPVHYRDGYKAMQNSYLQKYLLEL